MELLWIMLFGSFVLLTDRPMDMIAGANEIPLAKPISAITPGASIYIDVTSMIPARDLTIELSRKWVAENLQPGCVKATLQGKSAMPVVLEFKGNSSFEPGRLFVVLVSDSGVPTRHEFGKLTVTSCAPMGPVQVYWRNFQK